MPRPAAIDRALRNGCLEIDFQVAPFDSIGGLLLRATRLLFETLPFLAAITLLVNIPGKLALQIAMAALDIPAEGALSYVLMELADLLLSSLVIPAIVYGLIAHLRTGRNPPVAESFRWGRRQWGKTLRNKVKVEITIGLWSLLLIVPGIVAMVKLIFTDIIVAIEGDREKQVLPRSRELSKGIEWRIFVALLPMLPLTVLQTLATLRTLQFSPFVMVPVDGVFAVIEQWMTVLILLLYLGLPIHPEAHEPALRKRRAA